MRLPYVKLLVLHCTLYALFCLITGCNMYKVYYVLIYQISQQTETCRGQQKRRIVCSCYSREQSRTLRFTTEILCDIINAKTMMMNEDDNQATSVSLISHQSKSFVFAWGLRSTRKSIHANFMFKTTKVKIEIQFLIKLIQFNEHQIIASYDRGMRWLCDQRRH